MKKFRYQAKKKPGEFVEGVLMAESQDEAIDKINTLGLFPLEVHEEIASESRKTAVSRISSATKVSSRDIMMLYRQLAKMTQSGIPILRAIGFISEQAAHSGMRQVLEDIQTKVGQGENFSQALRGYPAIFSSFDLAMIAAGESVGKLNEALLQLAKYRGDQQALVSRVRGALAYPLFMLVMGVLTVSFMLTYVIPQFSRFFLDLGQNLPLPTQILIGISSWLQAYWFWIFLFVVFAVLMLRRIMRSEKEKIILDQWMLKIPLIGNLILKVEIARFSRSLEILIKNKMQVMNAIAIVIPIVQNQSIRSELEKSRQLMEQGGYLSEGLQQSNMFPKFVQHLIRTGEESGRLDESLAEIADWYESEIDETVKLTTSLMEPLVILVVGFLLGLIVIAVLMPVFSMNASVQ